MQDSSIQQSPHLLRSLLQVPTNPAAQSQHTCGCTQHATCVQCLAATCRQARQIRPAIPMLWASPSTRSSNSQTVDCNHSHHCWYIMLKSSGMMLLVTHHAVECWSPKSHMGKQSHPQHHKPFTEDAHKQLQYTHATPITCSDNSPAKLQQGAFTQRGTCFTL
jgi:hypothetical protein